MLYTGCQEILYTFNRQTAFSPVFLAKLFHVEQFYGLGACSREVTP